MKMTMYDTLLQLPLFQGLGRNDFTSILDKVKMHFSKYKPGDPIIHKNQRCNQLAFLLNGTVMSETSDRDNLFTLYEEIKAPQLFEPYSLFGWRTEYASTYVAASPCDVITIDKSYLLSELNNYEIIRLNYLNLLSNRAQNLNERLWTNVPGTTQARIVGFLLLHCLTPFGEKRLKIKMDDFAKLLTSTRIRISRALNEMEKKGWLTLHRGEIRIPDIAVMREEHEAQFVR